jgi:hypothetical protein
LHNPFITVRGDKAIIPLSTEHYYMTGITLDAKAWNHGWTYTYELCPRQHAFMGDDYAFAVLHGRVCLMVRAHSLARGFMSHFLGYKTIVITPYSVEKRDWLDQNTKWPWLHTDYDKIGLMGFHFEDVDDAMLFHLNFANTVIRRSKL